MFPSYSLNFSQFHAVFWKILAKKKFGTPYYGETWICTCKVKKTKQQVEWCRSSLCINLHCVQIPVIIMIMNKSMTRENNTQHGDTDTVIYSVHPVCLSSSTSFSYEFAPVFLFEFTWVSYMNSHKFLTWIHMSFSYEFTQVSHLSSHEFLTWVHMSFSHEFTQVSHMDSHEFLIWVCISFSLEFTQGFCMSSQEFLTWVHTSSSYEFKHEFLAWVQAWVSCVSLHEFLTWVQVSDHFACKVN